MQEIGQQLGGLVLGSVPTMIFFILTVVLYGLVGTIFVAARAVANNAPAVAGYGDFNEVWGTPRTSLSADRSLRIDSPAATRRFSATRCPQARKSQRSVAV